MRIHFAEFLYKVNVDKHVRHAYRLKRHTRQSLPWFLHFEIQEVFTLVVFYGMWLTGLT